MPCSANCATGVHACFGATSGTSSRSRATSGFPSAGGADGELCRTWSSPSGTSSRSRASASSRERPGAKRKLSSADGDRRDDVLRDPALDPHGAQHLAVDEPVELDVERLERAASGARPVHELVDRVASGPRPGRVRALAVELDARLEVPEAAGVEDAVRRLEHDGELDSAEHAAREDAGQRALLERHLLAREEDVARREPRRARARASPRRRPSCRSRRGRARRRRRSARGCCPAPAPCRHVRRERSGPRRRPRRSPRRRRRAARRAGGERTSSIAAPSWRLSDGTSTSSSVRAARSEAGTAGVIMTRG